MEGYEGAFPCPLLGRNKKYTETEGMCVQRAASLIQPPHIGQTGVKRGDPTAPTPNSRPSVGFPLLTPLLT